MYEHNLLIKYKQKWEIYILPQQTLLRNISVCAESIIYNPMGHKGLMQLFIRKFSWTNRIMTVSCYGLDPKLYGE